MSVLEDQPRPRCYTTATLHLLGREHPVPVLEWQPPSLMPEQLRGGTGPSRARLLLGFPGSCPALTAASAPWGVSSAWCLCTSSLSSAPFSPASASSSGSGPLWTFIHLRDPSLCASVPLSGTQHFVPWFPHLGAFCLLRDSVFRVPFSDFWVCCRPTPCLRPLPLVPRWGSLLPCLAPCPHCLRHLGPHSAVGKAGLVAGS